MRVVVVGAGIAGLVAARKLADNGAEVTVVERAPSVGGRMATRRIGAATFDHGAQFFTARTPAFIHQVDEWIERGLLRIWTTGFEVDDGYPRYVAPLGMNSLAKDLAAGSIIETSTMAFTIRDNADPASPRWSLVIDDGSTRHCDAIVLTVPLPQAFALLADSRVEMGETLFRTEYDRTIALLMVLDRPSLVPAPGALQHPDSTFSFVCDNALKGVSSVPALTLHGSAEWSEQHWPDDADEVSMLLQAAARPWIGDAHILDQQVKKWRFATPRKVWPEPCWVASGGTLVLAGDAFAGPRIEGAHNSGLAAAHALTA